MRRAICRALLRPLPTSRSRRYRILIDGLPLPEVGYPHEALVDGDARCQSIAAAAILAKTVRDRSCIGWPAATRGTGGTPTSATAPGAPGEGLRCTAPLAHHRLTFAPIARLPVDACCLARDEWR